MDVTETRDSRKSLAGRWIFIGLAVAAAALAVVVLRPAREQAGPKITGEIQHFTLHENPRAVPAVGFRDADGRRYTMADFRGRVVLLNFWASWCAPCLREMPALDALERHLGGPRFQVVAVSVDRGGQAAVAPFYRKAGIARLAIYLDPKGELQRAMGVVSLPTSVLIDARGREVGRLVGPAEWQAQEAVALVRHFMVRAGP